MKQKNHNVLDLEVILNVFVVIKWVIIMIYILGRSLILHVKIVLVKNLCLYLLDLNNVECIG